MIRLQLPCAFTLLLLTARLASAGVEIYASKPQAQTADPSFTGVLTQDFNLVPTGNLPTVVSSVGTYTNKSTDPTKAKISPNNNYGGYQQGNYLAVSPGGVASVTLNTPESYFGIFFTAADSTDTITLYDAANTVLGTFSTQRLTDFFASPTVTATNGTIYNSVAYKGQPTVDGSTPTIDAQEYFAYLNFVATGGTTIGRVDFSKTSGGGFESDNHSFSTTAPNLSRSTFVDLGPVPEPAALSFVLLGGLASGGLALRARRRAA